MEKTVHIKVSSPSGCAYGEVVADLSSNVLALKKLIQAQLLPTKSVGQIVAHFKNRSSRRAEDNPIKQLRLETPLTVREQQAVLEGVQRFGPNWDVVRARLLPCRNTNVIRRFYMRWKKMFFTHTYLTPSSASSTTTTVPQQPSKSITTIVGESGVTKEVFCKVFISVPTLPVPTLIPPAHKTADLLKSIPCNLNNRKSYSLA